MSNKKELERVTLAERTRSEVTEGVATGLGIAAGAGAALAAKGFGHIAVTALGKGFSKIGLIRKIFF